MRYRINYNKVISQANSLEEQISEFSTQIQLLKKLQQNCKAVWQGQALDIFLLKLDALYGEMNHTQQEMSRLVETIKYCAESIQHEDQQLAEQAAMLNAMHQY